MEVKLTTEPRVVNNVPGKPFVVWLHCEGRSRRPIFSGNALDCSEFVRKLANAGLDTMFPSNSHRRVR